MLKYIILSLLVTLNAYAVVPSGVPSYSLGGANANPSNVVVPDTNPNGWFEISAGGNSCTVGSSNPFYKNGSLYQVTAGKTASCVAIKYTTAGSGHFQLMSATATFNNNTAAGSLTGAKFQSGTSQQWVYAGSSADTTYVQAINYDFAASTWPGMDCGNSQVMSAILTCREH